MESVSGTPRVAGRPQQRVVERVGIEVGVPLQPLQSLLTELLGERPSLATVWRWTSRGVKSGGHFVKLRAVKIGGKLYSSRRDVECFISEQNANREDNSMSINEDRL